MVYRHSCENNTHKSYLIKTFSRLEPLVEECGEGVAKLCQWVVHHSTSNEKKGNRCEVYHSVSKIANTLGRSRRSTHEYLSKGRKGGLIMTRKCKNKNGYVTGIVITPTNKLLEMTGNKASERIIQKLDIDCAETAHRVCEDFTPTVQKLHTLYNKDTYKRENTYMRSDGLVTDISRFEDAEKLHVAKATAYVFDLKKILDKKKQDTEEQRKAAVRKRVEELYDEIDELECSISEEYREFSENCEREFEKHNARMELDEAVIERQERLEKRFEELTDLVKSLATSISHIALSQQNRIINITDTPSEELPTKESQAIQRPELPKPSKHKKAKLKGLERFEEFYQHYPRKKSRGHAEKAWLKIAEPEQEKAILGAKAYAKRTTEEKTEDRYIKHPATWLNGKCWEDQDLQTLEPHNALQENATSKENQGNAHSGVKYLNETDQKAHEALKKIIRPETYRAWFTDFHFVEVRYYGAEGNTKYVVFSAKSERYAKEIYNRFRIPLGTVAREILGADSFKIEHVSQATRVSSPSCIPQSPTPVQSNTKRVGGTRPVGNLFEQLRQSIEGH